jgi:CcmD family protein
MAGQMGYLWAVTAVVWLGILGYVISLMRRQGRMQKELDFIEHSLSELSKDRGKQ